MYTFSRMYPSRALACFEDYALTAYLFTKSDVKTILLPVVSLRDHPTIVCTVLTPI